MLVAVFSLKPALQNIFGSMKTSQCYCLRMDGIHQEQWEWALKYKDVIWFGFVQIETLKTRDHPWPWPGFSWKRYWVYHPHNFAIESSNFRHPHTHTYYLGSNKTTSKTALLMAIYCQLNTDSFLLTTLRSVAAALCPPCVMAAATMVPCVWPLPCDVGRGWGKWCGKLWGSQHQNWGYSITTYFMVVLYVVDSRMHDVMGHTRSYKQHHQG